jgi:hypothetical protein
VVEDEHPAAQNDKVRGVLPDCLVARLYASVDVNRELQQLRRVGACAGRPGGGRSEGRRHRRSNVRW